MDDKSTSTSVGRIYQAVAVKGHRIVRLGTSGEIRALGKIENESAVDSLIRALTDSNGEIRRRADCEKQLTHKPMRKRAMGSVHFVLVINVRFQWSRSLAHPSGFCTSCRLVEFRNVERNPIFYRGGVGVILTGS